MQTFISQAQSGRNSWLSYLSVILITFGFFFMGQFPLTIILLKTGQTEINYTESIAKHISYPLFFILLNLQFILALAALLLSVYLVHRRSPQSLITGSTKFRWNRLGWGMLVTILILVISEIVYYSLYADNYVWQFDSEKFFPFMMVAILTFPIQISFEEIFFRGYILQGFSLSTRSIFWGWIFSSVLFGLAHSFNTEVSEFGMLKMMIVYISLGLGLGFVTIYSQGLEIAMGFHLVNNLYVALIKTFPGSSLNTPSLFIIPAPDANYMIVESIIGMLIFILLAVFPYRVKNWKQLFSFNNSL